MGLMGQLNDSCPSSPGATHSINPFDCCVGGHWCWQVPSDEVGPSKATEAGMMIDAVRLEEWQFFHLSPPYYYYSGSGITRRG